MLGYVYLQWDTTDDIDRTSNISKCFLSNQVNEGEYYGLIHFGSIVSMVNALRSNISITLFTNKLPCPLHRFHLNRCIMVNGLQQPAKSEHLHDDTCDNQNNNHFHLFHKNYYLFILLLLLLAFSASVGQRDSQHSNLMFHNQRYFK